MKILVVITQTPDTTTNVRIASDGKSLNTEGITWIINPYSEFAIEKALRLKEAAADKISEIILIAMGPERITEALRQGLAMGADRAILVKSDEINIKTLAGEIQKIGAELILGGKKTIDTESSWLESALAAELGLALVAHANKLEWSGDHILATREISGSKQVFEVNARALITCDKGADEPRYASIMGIMKAKKKPLDEISISSSDDTGIEIIEAHLPPIRGACKIFAGSPEESSRQLLSALRTEAKVL